VVDNETRPSGSADATDVGSRSESAPVSSGGRAEDPRRALHREEAARDRALVERIKSGDKKAFDELYRLYHSRAYNIAFRVTKNADNALDVVQEAFVKVFKSLDGFEGTSSFYTWLYRIVMNLAIDRVRAETRDQRLVEFDERLAQDEGAIGVSAPERALNPLHRVLRSELSGRIREALDELPEYHQVAVVLREVDGLSYEEIAEVMDCPKGTVMSRLFHARRKMQEHLGPYLEGQLEIDD
jgi:RNA polymerase sigma-70 factor (ECF subfamily)